jgi:hypothetical protein
MTQEALKLALEALEKSQSALAEELSAWDIDPPLHHVQESHDLCGPAITSLRQAIAELESQEPYALEALMYSNDRIKVDPVTGNVSIGTPQRTEQEPVELPCCGYTDASAVKWNPFNRVCQCHNCGQTYKPPAQPQRTEPIQSLQCFHCQVTIETLNDKVMHLLAQRKPLTDTQKRELIKKSELWDMHIHIGWYSAPSKNFVEKAIQLISEIEAAYGIKENT